MHDDLEKVVKKHLTSEFKKPFAPFSLAAFEQLSEHVEQYLSANQTDVAAPARYLILDSCCGVGESTVRLAAQYPDALVIGIDKSEHRVEKNDHHQPEKVENYLVIRADLNDLWRLIAQKNWPIKKHFLLYPNPWPKSKHLQRRWHGAAVFPYIAQLSEQLIVRSNWSIYIDEFAAALKIQGYHAEPKAYLSDEPMTPFERKYWASGQQSYQLECCFS